ncbi:Uncharacterized protein DBV15_08290 [Temnothorax longispinosus]|uniref:Uncharacterized protein n=1 Tax=Temnothorax longispinosus TaxID=300112 RepID=A0A4S2KGH9_9HYME|nr:Uncharacterized protein DBV15_08290 [Temnothorax longispinosus]
MNTDWPLDPHLADFVKDQFSIPRWPASFILRNTGSIAYLHLRTLGRSVPVHGQANSANLLDFPVAVTMDMAPMAYGMAVLATVAWRLSSSTWDRCAAPRNADVSN